MAGTLWVVATPLGNLEDLSARAARLLGEVAAVYAEDTRRSRILLDHLGKRTPLVSLHTHNEQSRVREVAERLERGEDLVLLTDAGTPAVSDPGAALVAALAAEGARVLPVPGPSALTAALSVAGYAGEPAREVLFVGFLPAKGKERAQAAERVAAHRGIVVLFEAPHRLRETLEELAALDAGRAACACRELTKIHEEVRRGTVSELAAWAAGEVRGELTIVLGPKVTEEVPADDAAIDAALRRCLEAGLSARDASTAVAAVMELPRRRVYTRCQALGGEET